MKAKYKYVHPLALPPVYMTKGSACFDLHSVEQADIEPGKQVTIKTGLVFELPEGSVMFIFSRSGHAAKHGVRLANCVGVIDSDYRGEVCVMLRNDSDKMVVINAQDRIAQGMLMPIAPVELENTDIVSDTERGAGGFGSTG